MRLAARRDANHSEIVRALEQIGCSVLDLSRVGGGCPDLLVARNGRTMLLEIKDGAKPPSRRRLRGNQQDFFARWNGEAYRVTTVDEAMEVWK